MTLAFDAITDPVLLATEATKRLINNPDKRADSAALNTSTQRKCAHEQLICNNKVMGDGEFTAGVGYSRCLKGKRSCAFAVEGGARMRVFKFIKY